MKKLDFYLKKAKKEKWAIGQFNFCTLEHLKAIIKGGYSVKSPLILGMSEGEVKFFGLKEAIALKEIINLNYNIPIFLNLDHAKDLNFIKLAINMGCDAVHYDGSSLPLKENIENTKKIVSYARKKGVIIEGEVGIIGGSSIVNKNLFNLKNKLTSLEEAKEFSKKTEVDLLAVAIGNVHGIYPKMPKMDFSLLSKIEKEVDPFLVLHGASGIKDKDVKKTIEMGIVKVNINTELRKVWKESLKKELSSSEMKPYKILSNSEKFIQKKVVEKMFLLGSAFKI